MVVSKWWWMWKDGGWMALCQAKGNWEEWCQVISQAGESGPLPGPAKSGTC